MDNKKLVILIAVVIIALGIYKYALYPQKDTFVDTYGERNLAVGGVDEVAVNAAPVTFEKTGGYGNGYQLKMCLHHRYNQERNCNSIVGVMEYPQSSSHPSPFHSF